MCGHASEGAYLTVELLIGFILGIGGGLITNSLWERRTTMFQFISTRRTERLLHYDPEDDELYALNRWSPKTRELTRDHLVTIRTERPSQSWFDDDTLAAETNVQLRAGMHGHICYLTGVEIDHREAIENMDFTVGLAACEYAEQAAVMHLMRRSGPNVQAVRAAIQSDPKAYLSTACPASVVANIVVHSRDGKVLVVRRSKAVDTARNIWTLGVYETMRVSQDAPRGSVENFFSLCERGLREEVGLDMTVHYRDVFISWFGLYAPLLRTHLVAHVLLTCPTSDVDVRLESSEGVQEADAFDWLSLDWKSASHLISSPREKISHVPQFSALNRRWLEQTRLAAYESMRVRPGLR